MKMDGRLIAYTYMVFAAGAEFYCALSNVMDRDSIGTLIGTASCAGMLVWANWARTSSWFVKEQSNDKV